MDRQGHKCFAVSADPHSRCSEAKLKVQEIRNTDPGPKDTGPVALGLVAFSVAASSVVAVRHNTDARPLPRSVCDVTRRSTLQPLRVQSNSRASDSCAIAFTQKGHRALSAASWIPTDVTRSI